jgi:hypothetical protein
MWPGFLRAFDATGNRFYLMLLAARTPGSGPAMFRWNTYRVEPEK